MTTENRNGLGKILKQRRVMIPMTLTELSSATGVSGSHLSRIEMGERSPSGYVLRKIAKPLGFEEDELLILAGFKSPNPAEKVEVFSSTVDPYVAKLLSQEPVEIQRAVVAMLIFIKSVAVAKSIRSGCNIGLAEYVHRNYPQVDEDIITMIKDILENPEGGR